MSWKHNTLLPQWEHGPPGCSSPAEGSSMAWDRGSISSLQHMSVKMPGQIPCCLPLSAESIPFTKCFPTHAQQHDHVNMTTMASEWLILTSSKSLLHYHLLHEAYPGPPVKTVVYPHLSTPPSSFPAPFFQFSFLICNLRENTPCRPLTPGTELAKDPHCSDLKSITASQRRQHLPQAVHSPWPGMSRRRRTPAAQPGLGDTQRALPNQDVPTHPPLFSSLRVRLTWWLRTQACPGGVPIFPHTGISSKEPLACLTPAWCLLLRRPGSYYGTYVLIC